MKGTNIIKGPILPTTSNLVYSITLLSGNIVTNPAGFGAEEDIWENDRWKEVEPVVDRENILDKQITLGEKITG